jgi:hypothetical protein
VRQGDEQSTVRVNAQLGERAVGSTCGGAEGVVGLVALAGLEAEVELAEHPVDQMAQCGWVPVAVVSSASVVPVGVLVVGHGGEAQAQPAARRSFLTRRWVTEIERPEARVMGADPA